MLLHMLNDSYEYLNSRWAQEYVICVFIFLVDQ